MQQQRRYASYEEGLLALCNNREVTKRAYSNTRCMCVGLLSTAVEKFKYHVSLAALRMSVSRVREKSLNFGDIMARARARMFGGLVVDGYQRPRMAFKLANSG